MKKLLIVLSLFLASCVLEGNGLHNIPIHEPDCSEAHLQVPMPPIWSINECWDECCMYSYMGCQQTYCYWEGNYDCYWERKEVYCW